MNEQPAGEPKRNHSICPLSERCHQKLQVKENEMNVKINEDWLATIIGFVLLLLAMINFIKPEWVKF